MVEVTNDKDRVVLEGVGVFNDSIHGSDIGISGSGVGVGSGIAVKIDE